MSAADNGTRGQFTLAEIQQQPETWHTTFELVQKAAPGKLTPPVITGAGTSAYAAMAVEAAWPGARAIASTELFQDCENLLTGHSVVVSLARSGDSPESVAVVEKVQRKLPQVRHVALTCNPKGRLASWSGVEAILLDPRSNDRSLVMTSSFTNLVLAGACLVRPEELESALPALCDGAETILEKYIGKAESLAQNPPRRVVALASLPLSGAAREACLKITEMTSGRIATLAETYLGLRHGPMSFVEPDTLVICFVSSDPKRQRYEMDLVTELRTKQIGRLLAIAPANAETELFDEVVSTSACALPDYLRTPADIVFCQLLGYYLSLQAGLDPDSPSPDGVINRVVQGVRIYED